MLAMDDIKTMLIFREEDEKFKNLLDEYRQAKRALISYLHSEGFVCGVGPGKQGEAASGN